ncbi:hypothetical protein [Apilactobacillus xinyiensis]|uniref:hypothetical protein n=1 Tax=Apilactobacillus xinyiensis TaxID=2841032 RepID=UPI001C7D6E81|nr:hypothetical protein [Apilactobacillus xinyiensis]
MTAIIILMIIFAVLQLIVGSFLFKHQNKPFMSFHPENDPLLSKIIKNFGITFIILFIISVISIIIANMIFMMIVIFVSCMIVMAMQLTLSKFFLK